MIHIICTSEGSLICRLVPEGLHR